MDDVTNGREFAPCQRPPEDGTHRRIGELAIGDIEAGGRQFVLVAHGGGSLAIDEILQLPGASKTMLEASVTFAPSSLEHWLGGPVDMSRCESAARAAAMASFMQARRLSNAAPATLCGVGSMAEVETDRTTRRVHVAWQSVEQTVVRSWQIQTGRRTCAEEEQLIARLISTTVAEACGLEPPAVTLLDSESHNMRRKLAPPSWSELLLSGRAFVDVGSDLVRPPGRRPEVLFPGAFHPVHEGHRGMAEVAARKIGWPVTLELSIQNVDKAPLDFIEIDDRLQLVGDLPIVLTRAATFVQKAALFPGCVFVVGADTVTRIGDFRYYGNDVRRRDEAIHSLAEFGCRFLVFGRALEGRFCTLTDLELPAALRDLCLEVSEKEFRSDLSSTRLRAACGR